jgi:hypothetical protein
MTCSLCSTSKQPLYVENYDSARIETLKNTENCKEILYDKGIFWRVFCNSFNASHPNFGTLSTDHQMHVHFPLDPALVLQGIVEVIRRLFVDAVSNQCPLTLWVEEKREQIEIENIDNEDPSGPDAVINYHLVDFSFHKLIVSLNVALESAGARKIDFNQLNNRVHRVDIEWKSNPVLLDIDREKLFEERAEKQYTLILEALGGFQTVKDLPVVESCHDVKLITAPVMRSVDYSFFVFRYIVRDEHQDLETIYYTALINMQKTLSIATEDNNGWVFREIGDSDGYSECGQIGPPGLNSDVAHLEFTCSRIKKLVQKSPVGILIHVSTWTEDEELTSDGKSAVELV